MTLLQIDNAKGNASIGADLFTPACRTSPLCSREICDTTLSIAERVASLVNDLTTEEKIVVNEALPKTQPRGHAKTWNGAQVRALFKDPTFPTFTMIWVFHAIGGMQITP